MKRTTLTLLSLTALLVWGATLSPAVRARGRSSSEANKALARRVAEEVWNQGNTAAIDALFTPTAVTHGRTPAEDIQGADGFKQYVTGLRTTFPDLHLAIEDQIAEGDKVANRFTMHGTQKGEMRLGANTLPPSGKQVTVTGIVINRIQDGKVAETWVNVDQLGLLEQLGLFPPPAPPRATSP